MLRRLPSVGVWLAVVSAALWLITLPALGEDRFDLRNVHWGMSPEAVARAEKGKPIFRDDRRMVFGATALDRRVTLAYHFAGGRLFQAVLTLAEEYLLEEQYLRDFLLFKSALTAKYGAPVRDETIWHRPYMQNDPSRWGVAVSIGHLTLETRWRNEASDIAALLTGADYAVACRIRYASRELAHLAGENGGSETDLPPGPDSPKALDAF